MLEKVVAECRQEDLAKYGYRACKSLARTYASKMNKEKMQRALLNAKRILYMYLNDQDGVALSSITQEQA